MSFGWFQYGYMFFFIWVFVCLCVLSRVFHGDFLGVFLWFHMVFTFFL